MSDLKLHATSSLGYVARTKEKFQHRSGESIRHFRQLGISFLTLRVFMVRGNLTKTLRHGLQLSMQGGELDDDELEQIR